MRITDRDSQSGRLRVVLCMGEYCNLGRRAEKLYKILAPQVAAINGQATASQPAIRLETARCLSMCAIGPNCVIYPDDAVFNKLDEQQLADIIDTYLIREPDER